MKRRLRVLVTSVGSNTSICVIKGLRRQAIYDVYIIGTDINNREDIAGSFLCDSFYKVPLASDTKNYIDALKRIVTVEAIDLLVPINNTEVEVIGKNRETLDKSTFILISPQETIEICNDKLKTYAFFQKTKIPTVSTYAPKKDTSSEVTRAGLTYPLIAKPRRGLGSRGVYEITDEKDYDALVRKIDDPIIQEKVGGIEYTIDVFCEDGVLISAIPRKRIEARAGISYKGETENEQTLINYAALISKELKIVGPANLQCFKSNEGVKFIEINPRFSGGLILSIAAGVNSPLFALKMAIGEKLLPVTDFKVKRMCRYLEEVFYPSDYLSEVELNLKTSMLKISDAPTVTSPSIPKEAISAVTKITK
jgi:carbamoyl-phosphate synthase large subunit